MVSTHMEKRVSERKSISIGAELISDRVSYAAIIRNVSESGLSVIISPIENASDFSGKSELYLKFPLPSGELLHLGCKKIWSNKILPDRMTRIIGMEIMSPPMQYKGFVNTIH
jgi:hypothetical protein